MGALSIEQVLAEEASAIHGDSLRSSDLSLTHRPTGQEAQAARATMDADRRDGLDLDVGEVERRKAFYRSLNKLRRAALCCSGGGIRSATFCLGVIQALAKYDVNSPPPPPSNSPSNRSGSKVEQPQMAPENSLLGRFQYLSTVSGGGYIGSWLSAWRKRNDFPAIFRNLTSRPDGPDVEPPEISWLRAYSNYLTPKVGIGSADTWTGIAIYLRNLLLNWLIIIPAVCIALLLLKFVATGSVWAARDGAWWLLALIGLLGAACLIVALAFTTSHRPTRREKPGMMVSARSGNITQTTFLNCDLAWSLASAVLVTSFFTSQFGVTWVVNTGKHWALALTAAAGLLIYGAGWIAGWPLRPKCKDFLFWACSGLVYGALVGLGAYLFTLLRPYGASGTISPRHELWNLLLPMIFGVPWVLLSQLVAEMIFVGLTSYEIDSDSDREWLGRAAGWVAASAIIWAIVAFLTLAGGHFVLKSIEVLGPLVGSVGGVAGIVTALLGKSSQTQAKPKGGNQSVKSSIADIVLAIAGPIFAAALIIALSVGLDKFLIGDSLVEALRIQAPPAGSILTWLFAGLVIAIAVEWIASRNVNINRFSLHAVYRNRLMRAYLGASRQKRDPDNFTGFDIEDNVRVHKLWPTKASPDGTRWDSLFHVVNIALNVVSAKRLAWQERKAESFTVSPLHSGSAYKGFRASEKYGDYPDKGGISLGTAMAISGAAASPNMGYHSSPSITLLLALFNVRLGWWLGNPGNEGEKYYQTDGPSLALRPLIEETFGLTTDDKPYVYLSDGGHFENLGLYEMVRRRCRFIVAIDAGCDPNFDFEDLGNAVRKIYIDLGIRIRFDDLQSIRNRPSNKAMRRASTKAGNDARMTIPYYTIGVIDYESADGKEEGCGEGYILYIKPAYHGTEGAGIRSYAAAHPTFPHESTGDQWFTESQFESYRSLGLDIANSILGQKVVLQPGLTLHQVLANLPNTIRS